MPAILGLQRLVDKLRDKAARSLKDDDSSVVVGYTQAYAIYVHENMEAIHPVGQAKFLEHPARELSDGGVLSGIVYEAMRKGKSMLQGLIVAGERLQRESQKLVPVDTGALKGSAFTRVEKGRGENQEAI